MHLSFIPGSPSTPPPKTYKPLSPKLSPKANHQIAAALATMPEQKLLLLFFARACSDQQKSAVKDIDAAISEIKHTTEIFAASDSEELFKRRDDDFVVHIIKANRQFVKGYDRYIELLEADAKSKGIEVWSLEVRQIEGLVGEWEAVSPDGEWSATSIMKLGDIDEKIVVDWGRVKGKAFKLWEEKKKPKGGDKSDTESVASCESKESDDAKSDVGNESMEYISPSKIVTKEEKQDAFTTPEGSGLRTPERALSADSATPLPSKIFELNFSPARRSAKALRSKSPRSSPLPKVTPTPAQSIPTSPPSTTFDFSVAKPIPVEVTPVAAIPSYTFGSGSGPRFTTAPIVYLSGASNTMESAQATSNDGQKKAEAAVIVTPLNPILLDESGTMESAQATTETKAVAPPNPPPQPIFNLRTLRPSSISTPPTTPSLASSFNFNDLSKALPNGREMRTPTPSTLTILTKTTQSLQTSVNDVHSALYGLDSTTSAPQSAKDAGLLLMNNYIGEWVTDLRIQTNTLKTKIDEIGTQVQDIGQNFATLKSTTRNAITEVSTATTIAEAIAGRKDTEALNEIKEMMTKQMKEIQELRGHEQTSSAALLRQNNELMQELAKVKRTQNVAEEDVKLLRAENREFKKLVEEEAKLLRAENREIKKLIEKTTRKVEFAVAHQLGLEAREKEGEGDMDDALMEIFWPQGWDDDEGVKKRDEGKDLARGVLADEPGFRIPKHRLGRGKGSGGWCTVM